MQNEAAVPAGFLEGLCEEYRKNNQIDPSAYEKWEVKRGLRNADGTGVVAGVTESPTFGATTFRTGTGCLCPASSSTGAST